MVGKRLLTLIVMIGLMALLIAGVALAAGELAPSEDPDVTTSTVAPDTSTGDEGPDTTEGTTTTETTVADDGTTDDSTTDDGTTDDTTTETDTTDTTAFAEDGDEDATDDEAADEVSEAHPDNFGAIISGLRHSGDHTPAAVYKGKKVPGWNKNHPTTTTIITTQPPVEG
jgi:cytoskeletal protein RodZ